jgi:hypothetical protein
MNWKHTPLLVGILMPLLLAEGASPGMHAQFVLPYHEPHLVYGQPNLPVFRVQSLRGGWKNLLPSMGGQHKTNGAEDVVHDTHPLSTICSVAQAIRQADVIQVLLLRI